MRDTAADTTIIHMMDLWNRYLMQYRNQKKSEVLIGLASKGEHQRLQSRGKQRDFSREVCEVCEVFWSLVKCLEVLWNLMKSHEFFWRLEVSWSLLKSFEVLKSWCPLFLPWLQSWSLGSLVKLGMHWARAFRVPNFWGSVFLVPGIPELGSRIIKSS